MSDITLSLDPKTMDINAIHAFLTGSYWSRGIPVEVVARAVAGSVCVGAFDGAAQVGFARLVTDRATFAYLADVYVLEPYRGRGLARRMCTVRRLPKLISSAVWQGLETPSGPCCATCFGDRCGVTALAAPDLGQQLPTDRKSMGMVQLTQRRALSLIHI